MVGIKTLIFITDHQPTSIDYIEDSALVEPELKNLAKSNDNMIPTNMAVVQITTVVSKEGIHAEMSNPIF
jgi:hypothetical protein